MTKTISLADDAYHALAACKRPGESFSDVARRLAAKERRSGLLDLAGAWRLGEDEAREVVRRVRARRDEADEGRSRVEFP